MIKYILFFFISLSSAPVFAVEAGSYICDSVECGASTGWTMGNSTTPDYNNFSCLTRGAVFGGSRPGHFTGNKCYTNDTNALIYVFHAATGSCPASSTMVDYVCVCTAPKIDSSDKLSCIDPPVTCDAAGVKNGSYGKEFTLPGTTVPDTVCVGGCSFNVTDGISSGSDSYLVIGRAASSTACTSSTGLMAKPSSPVSPPTPNSCLAEGKSYITMNSVTSCVGAGTSGAAPVTVTQNSTGAVSGVAGISTTQVVDRQEGGNVTRTVTETSPSGVVSSTTTNAPISSFCEKNPDSAMCKEKKGSATGGGNCTSPPTCDGDAIMCAQLLQTWIARCESQASSSIRTLGENVLNGADPLANKPDPANPTVVPVGTLNTSEIFSSTSCPAPVPMNFSVMGNAVALSFDLTPFCALGGVLGLLNVLASLFAAGRIISGGI